MPPWQADPRFDHFGNSRHLTKDRARHRDRLDPRRRAAGPATQSAAAARVRGRRLAARRARPGGRRRPSRSRSRPARARSRARSRSRSTSPPTDGSPASSSAPRTRACVYRMAAWIVDPPGGCGGEARGRDPGSLRPVPRRGCRAADPLVRAAGRRALPRPVGPRRRAGARARRHGPSAAPGIDACGSRSTTGASRVTATARSRTRSRLGLYPRSHRRSGRSRSCSRASWRRRGDARAPPIASG